MLAIKTNMKFELPKFFKRASQESKKNERKPIEEYSAESRKTMAAKRPNELLEQLKSVSCWLNKEDYFLKPEEKKLANVLRKMLGSARKEANIAAEIQEYSKKYPELLKTYAEILKTVREKEEAKIQEKIENALARILPNEKLKRRLDEKTIPLGKEMDAAKKEIIAENFPDGNFLLHTTSIDNALSIIESGFLMSGFEIEAIKKRKWRRGGGPGISFNMNDVRVLTGDEKHFIGFLASPETILNEKLHLSVPYSAAVYEVQLLARNISHPQPYVFWEGEYSGETEDLPKIPLDKVFVLLNEGDAGRMKDMLARYGRNPKGILTYPRPALRVESWDKPAGDHKIAGELLQKTTSEAGLHPSINWERDLFPRKPKIENDTYVDAGDVAASRCIIKDESGLMVTDCGENVSESKKEAA